jgi:uncharacterized protein
MSPSDTSRLIAVTIAGPAGPLEGLLQERESGTPAITALLCHPHPLYGGTLHNKVVHRLAGTLHELGVAVLRFNFRGVGKSAGTHGRGEGELDDARAALVWLRERHPDARRWIGGFSFGAGIAARLAASEPDAERMILVAPPIRTASFEALHTSRVPKLVIQGTADDVCPLASLQEEYARWAEPRSLVLVEGGTHFFDRQLAALGEALRQALAEAARESTS